MSKSLICASIITLLAPLSQAAMGGFEFSGQVGFNSTIHGDCADTKTDLLGNLQTGTQANAVSAGQERCLTFVQPTIGLGVSTSFGSKIVIRGSLELGSSDKHTIAYRAPQIGGFVHVNGDGAAGNNTATVATTTADLTVEPKAKVALEVYYPYQGILVGLKGMRTMDEYVVTSATTATQGMPNTSSAISLINDVTFTGATGDSKQDEAIYYVGPSVRLNGKFKGLALAADVSYLMGKIEDKSSSQAKVAMTSVDSKNLSAHISVGYSK